MLSKMFGQARDFCPKCGTSCLADDEICPSCGCDLDELYEQLTDEDIKMMLATENEAFLLNCWRTLNTLSLFISLWSPWRYYVTDFIFFPPKRETISGIGFILSYCVGYIRSIIDWQSEHYFSWITLIANLIGIGGFFLVIYVLLSGLRVFLRAKSLGPFNTISLLPISTAACTILLQVFISSQVLGSLLWGYWLCCISLLSTLLLEIRSLRSRPSSSTARYTYS
jgi:hypothetical protein